jgi:thiol-disulfide isomerase/thioredoxin
MPAALRRSVLVALALGVAADASAQEYFAHEELDYWREYKVQARAPDENGPPTPVAERPAVRRIDQQPFDWRDYENPDTEQFWDDGGDFVPARPLRVAAANPTPENVGRYLEWQKRKLEVIGALQAAVAKVAEPGAQPVTPGPAQPGGRSVATSTPQAIGPGGVVPGAEPVVWSEVELVLFYRSDCPHCVASIPTVDALRAEGARVVAVQIDWRDRPPVFAGSVPYTAEIAAMEPVEAVPMWVANYRGSRAVMQGEMSPRAVEVTLQALAKRS